MTGQWIFICGPSGAGKDSVIAWARAALASQSEIVFTRRLITRAAQPASDHDPVGKDDFLAMQKSGSLRWCWQAHGFCYGISQHYATHVDAGRIVVVNGSRNHVDSLPASLDVKRVEITASPENVTVRLAQRGRDTEQEVVKRLARNASIEQAVAPATDLSINNDGELAEAGLTLAAYLAAQAGIRVPLTRSSTAA